MYFIEIISLKLHSNSCWTVSCYQCQGYDGMLVLYFSPDGPTLFSPHPWGMGRDRQLGGQGTWGMSQKDRVDLQVVWRFSTQRIKDAQSRISGRWCRSMLSAWRGKDRGVTVSGRGTTGLTSGGFYSSLTWAPQPCSDHLAPARWNPHSDHQNQAQVHFSRFLPQALSSLRSWDQGRPGA